MLACLMQSTADHDYYTHQKHWDRSHINPTTLVGNLLWWDLSNTSNAFTDFTRNSHFDKSVTNGSSVMLNYSIDSDLFPRTTPIFTQQSLT